VRSWDFGVAVLVGGLAVAFGQDEKVLDKGVTIALAAGAAGVAVLGVVLAALAVITAFFDGHYRRVLESTGSIRRAMAPYLVTAGVAGAAALCALVTALGWPEFGSTLRIGTLALTVFLTAWAMAGTVSLVEITIFHAEQRAALMRGIEAAGDVRAARLTEARSRR
jgi:hypothetical protein